MMVSWKVLKNGSGGEFDWVLVGVGVASFIAYLFEVPAPFVILIAGLIGTFAFR
jgi:chromate transport protein ChrA